MADPPNLADLAKRYVDLWQDHLIAMAADPALAESTTRLLAALVPAGWPPAAGPFAAAAWAHEQPAAPAGTSAAGPASGERDRRMAELARRLAALEERVAALEGGIRIAGRRAQAKPHRSRK